MAEDCYLLNCGAFTLLVPKSTGRNDPCPCGSGIKLKKCDHQHVYDRLWEDLALEGFTEADLVPDAERVVYSKRGQED